MSASLVNNMHVSTFCCQRQFVRKLAIETTRRKQAPKEDLRQRAPNCAPAQIGTHVTCMHALQSCWNAGHQWACQVRANGGDAGQTSCGDLQPEACQDARCYVFWHGVYNTKACD